MIPDVRRIFLAVAICCLMGTAAQAQHAQPPSTLASELCSCMGTISMDDDDRSFDLAVRNCLNTVIPRHSREVVELLQQHPGQERRLYLLGLVLGHTLDRTCPQYPLVKERLRFLQEGAADTSTSPNT